MESSVEIPLAQPKVDTPITTPQAAVKLGSPIFLPEISDESLSPIPSQPSHVRPIARSARHRAAVSDPQFMAPRVVPKFVTAISLPERLEPETLPPSLRQDNRAPPPPRLNLHRATSSDSQFNGPSPLLPSPASTRTSMTMTSGPTSVCSSNTPLVRRQNASTYSSPLLGMKPRTSTSSDLTFTGSLIKRDNMLDGRNKSAPQASSGSIVSAFASLSPRHDTHTRSKSVYATADHRQMSTPHFQDDTEDIFGRTSKDYDLPSSRWMFKGPNCTTGLGINDRESGHGQYNFHVSSPIDFDANSHKDVRSDDRVIEPKVNYVDNIDSNQNDMKFDIVELEVDSPEFDEGDADAGVGNSCVEWNGHGSDSRNVWNDMTIYDLDDGNDAEDEEDEDQRKAGCAVVDDDDDEADEVNENRQQRLSFALDFSLPLNGIE